MTKTLTTIGFAADNSLHYQADRSRGIALLSVLWIVALLSMVALSVTSGVRSETRMARNMLSSTQAQYAAEGAIELAVSKLLLPKPDTWLADGTVRRIRIANAQVNVVIFDEAGKIDLNYASDSLLNNLLKTANVEAEQRLPLVDAIMDWRDTDNLRRLYGAEDDDYSAAGLPYGAKDARFDTVDELLLVLGMRPEILQAIRPVLTVFSRRPGVDPKVASEQALQVFAGGNSENVDAYIEQRRTLSENGGKASFNFMDNKLVTVSGKSIYTIHVESRVDESVVARVAATIKLVGGAEVYRLLRWKRVADPLSGNRTADGTDDMPGAIAWGPDE